MLLNFILVLGAFVGMEFVAWFTHKYVLHGWLWWLHRSHHVRHEHAFERNDFFFLYYAAIATVLFIIGSDEMTWPFWVAVGVTLYGLVYFLLHDVFIHQRIKLFGKAGNAYLRALNMAHKMHHKTTGRNGSESFGMLLVPLKYYRLALQKPARIAQNPEAQNR